MRPFVLWVVARPRLVIAFTLLLTLALAPWVSRLEVRLDVEAQIPQGHPLVRVGAKLDRAFGGKLATVVGFYPRSGTIYDSGVLERVERVTRQLEAMPGIQRGSVLSLLAQDLVDVQSDEETLAVRAFAQEVPRTAEELHDFEARVARNHGLTSLLVGSDGRATAVVFDFENYEAAGGAKDFYRRLEAILEPERSPELEIVAAGAPTILHWLVIYTRRVAGLFGLAVVVIGFIHYLAFRTLQGTLLPLITALLGVIWALGLMGLFEAPLDPWNIMTPVLVLAIGAGHSVQILKRYYEELSALESTTSDSLECNRAAVVRATTRVGPVMLTAGGIAALSFASLISFELPSIRTFGLLTALGIIATLVIEMTFIPAVRVLLPPRSASPPRDEFFTTVLEKLVGIFRRGEERRFLIAFGVALGFAVFGAFQLRLGNSMSAQFFEANAPVRGFRLADTRLAGTRLVQVLLETDQTTLHAPPVLHAMKELSHFIETDPTPVGTVLSLVDVYEQLDAGIRNVPLEKAELPLSEAHSAQLLLLYTLNGETELLSRLVNSDFKTGVMNVYMKTDDYTSLQKFVARVQSKAEELFSTLHVHANVGGGMTTILALNETMVHGKVRNMVQVSALVIFMSALLLRSLVAGFLVFLPLATSALMNLGVMGFLGVPLSMGTAAISAMSIGIGADYAIYFLCRVREAQTQQANLREAVLTALFTSGKAIIYVASAVATGYLCLTLSGFKMHVLLGCLVALAMLGACLATLVLLPTLVLWIEPNFLKRNSS